MSVIEVSNFTACVGLYLIHSFNVVMCVTLSCNYNAREDSSKP